MHLFQTLNLQEERRCSQMRTTHLGLKNDQESTVCSVNILLSMVSVFVAIFIWMRNSPDYLVRLVLFQLINSECSGVYSLRLLLE